MSLTDKFPPGTETPGFDAKEAARNALQRQAVPLLDAIAELEQWPASKDGRTFTHTVENDGNKLTINLLHGPQEAGYMSFVYYAGRFNAADCFKYEWEKSINKYLMAARHYGVGKDDVVNSILAKHVAATRPDDKTALKKLTSKPIALRTLGK